MNKNRYDAVVEISDILYSVPTDYRIGQFIFNSFQVSDMFYNSDQEFIQSLKKHLEEVKKGFNESRNQDKA